MARARNIKPNFFTNEYLAELDPVARLLFIGLWCQSDREGRLQDRPKRLKIDILPYDNCEVDKLLNDLACSKGDFITRYEVDGNKYIQIINFNKHQNPHIREIASIIPECNPTLALYKHHANTSTKLCENGDNTGTDLGNNSTNILHEQEVHSTSRADSLLPITDSLLPISTLSSIDIDPPDSIICPYDDIVKLFNSICISLPNVKQISVGRKKKIKARWCEIKTLDGFKTLFKKVESNSFLKGSNKNIWKATFDWLMGNDGNYVKVLEGNYDSDGTKPPPYTPKADKSNRNNFDQRDYDESYYGDFFNNSKGEKQK